MKKTLFLTVLGALLALNVSVAQKFDSNTRYRIMVHGVPGFLVDNQYGYEDDVRYTTLSYLTGTEVSVSNVGQWWYIRRSSGGWTLQNALTNRYLEFRKYMSSYNWDGQVHVYENQVIRTGESFIGDSAVWRFEYEDGTFRLKSSASPEWYLGAYHWKDTEYEGVSLDPMMSSWASERYLMAFDIYAEDGSLMTGEGMPGFVMQSLHLNGKTPLRLNDADDYLVTMPESAADKAYDVRVTWDGLKEGEAYRLSVDGVVATEDGFRIDGVSCQQSYPFRILDGEDMDIFSGALCFTTLPIVELRASGINGSEYVKATFRLQDPDYAGIDTLYTGLTKVRGATAQRYAKKPYNVKLYKEDGITEQDANLLGLRNTHTWILDAMYVDRIRMRNRVCFDTWNEMDRLPYNTNYNQRNGTLGRFVEVFVNGEYRGIYCLTDKINRKLLNLTKVEIDPLDSTDVTPRGLLYKGKQWGDDTYLRAVPSGSLSSTVTWGNWELEYPDEYPSTAAWTPLRNLINYGKVSDAKFAANFDQYYYFGNLLNYVMLQLAYNLEDNGMKNMYVSTKNIQKAGKRMVFTVWDMDSSLGGLWDGQHNDIVADTSYVTRVYPLSRLFSKNLMGFRDSLRLKWQDLKYNTLSAESLSLKLDQYATLLTESGAWAREYALWGVMSDLTENLWDEIQYVKEWYARNMEYLDGLLPDLPTGVERLTTAPKASDGIYTIDGRRVEGCSWQDLPKGIYIINGRKVLR